MTELGLLEDLTILLDFYLTIRRLICTLLRWVIWELSGKQKALQKKFQYHNSIFANYLRIQAL